MGLIFPKFADINYRRHEEAILGEYQKLKGMPRSVVRLMVEIIEPHGGTVFDPACGSGGMFVQSAQFIAVNGLRGEIKQGITY